MLPNAPQADFLPAVSKAGVRGMNFHGGPTGAYASIVFEPGAPGVPVVRPLFYGHYLFSQLVANHSTWIAVDVAAPPDHTAAGAGTGAGAGAGVGAAGPDPMCQRGVKGTSLYDHRQISVACCAASCAPTGCLTSPCSGSVPGIATCTPMPSLPSAGVVHANRSLRVLMLHAHGRTGTREWKHWRGVHRWTQTCKASALRAHQRADSTNPIVLSNRNRRSCCVDTVRERGMSCAANAPPCAIDRDWTPLLVAHATKDVCGPVGMRAAAAFAHRIAIGSGRNLMSPIL